MYCPSCGTEVTEELRYCNRCGANLKPLSNQASAPPVKSAGAAWAISAGVAVVTLGGFAFIHRVIMALISRGLNISEGGMALIFATLMTILAIDWLLIRQLPRLTNRPLVSDDAADKPEKRKLGEKPIAQIAALREPATSVTDHTTRTFETVRRDRDRDTRG